MASSAEHVPQDDVGDESPRSGIRDTDPPDPPAELLARHGARVLDPATASKLPDATGALTVTPGRTVYVADSLVVPSPLLGRVVDLVSELVPNVRAVPNPAHVVIRDSPAQEEQEVEPGAGEEVVPIVPAVTVRLLSTVLGDPPPDAWSVLLTLRAATGDELSDVELQNLLFGTDSRTVLNGTPGTQGFAGDTTGFRDNGLGGRQPVRVLRPGSGEKKSDVTVAILDTGLGENPLLVEGIERLEGIKLDHLIPDPEKTGDVYGPLDGLMDRCGGHGTFIAGIIRQLCPSATIMPIPVMGADGVALKVDLINALRALPKTVDIVVLSMGYYTEQPLVDAQGAPTEFHGLLYQAIKDLGARGVAVVAAGGNDATSRPMYPAAFAADPQEGGGVPVISVGALNLDGSVALFANSGPWITAWRCGVNLVSTLPTSFNGGLAPSVSMSDPVRPPRRGVDPDNFREGMATWFGSSFSAPILAGELAHELIIKPPRDGGRGGGSTGAKTDLVLAAIEKLKPADPPTADELEP